MSAALLITIWETRFISSSIREESTLKIVETLEIAASFEAIFWSIVLSSSIFSSLTVFSFASEDVCEDNFFSDEESSKGTSPAWLFFDFVLSLSKINLFLRALRSIGSIFIRPQYQKIFQHRYF